MTSDGIGASPERLHFSGIAGKGIAPAAALALQAGHQVTGDDLVSNHRIALLRAAGADVRIGQNLDPPTGTDWQVRSGLVPAMGTIPQRPRLSAVSDMLSAAENSFLAIAGSVGKSTAAAICLAAHGTKFPSCYIGADVPGTLCGGRLNRNSLAIIEADEYRDAYREISADMLILLNIFPNHEDYFGPGTVGFAKSFVRWQAEQPARPSDTFVSSQAAAELRNNGLHGSYNIVGNSQDRAANWNYEITAKEPRSTTLRIGRNGVRQEFMVPLTGDHVAFAAAVGILSAQAWGIPDNDIREGLRTASLPLRRQTLVHEAPGIWVYDDNARLPVQFEMTVLALRQKHPGAQVIAVISPWGRLNQRDLNQWAQAGAAADELCILPVGTASTRCGGAERPDADTLLVSLVESLGRRGHAIKHWEQLPAISGETVYLTAGYDAQMELFSECHSHLREKYPSSG